MGEFICYTTLHSWSLYLSALRCPVNGKMRAVLVDWLVEVHSQFKLLQETLYMTVYVIDKFLQVRITPTLPRST